MIWSSNPQDAAAAVLQQADTLRWWHTLVRTVHDTVHVLRPAPDAFWGLSRAELLQVLVAFIGVLVPIVVLWWEVWGRLWLRERKPVARLFYQEILTNYLTLMSHDRDLYELHGDQPIVGVPALPDIILGHRVFDAFQERVGVLPDDLPERVVRLYSLTEHLPRFQQLSRLPGAPMNARGNVLHIIREGQSVAMRILVRLHKLNNIQEDLRVVLRGSVYSITASANEEDSLREEWALRGIPGPLRNVVRRFRRWRMRRRLWRELRDSTNIP
jgi:hypothetical protein